MTIALFAALTVLAAGEERLVRAPEGWVTLGTHLSTQAYPGDPEQQARGFLREHGPKYGLAHGDEGLRFASGPRTAGGFGVVVFGREVAGLPVLQGQVMVALTPEGRVHAAGSSGPLPSARGAFVVSAAAARAIALRRLEGEIVSFVPAWALEPSRLRPVYRVGVVAQLPYRSESFLIDAQTGTVGPSVSQLLNAGQSVAYAVSPSQPGAPAAACSTTTASNGNVTYDLCATPGSVSLLDLNANATTLSGSRTVVYNCQGGATYSSSACSQTLHANGSGDFIASNPSSYDFNATDQESEAMAYYHVDLHSRFMSGLDPGFGGLPLIPAYTNAYAGTQPYENATYDLNNKIIVFGQGQGVDFAFDGTIIHHEMTHAACDAIATAGGIQGSLTVNIDQGGIFWIPCR
ncbi:MAG: hypothetical protein QM723_07370 [Myxococcaceae bacterium]